MLECYLREKQKERIRVTNEASWRIPMLAVQISQLRDESVIYVSTHVCICTHLSDSAFAG